MDQQQALKIIVKAQDDASATLKAVQAEARKTGDAVASASRDGGAAMDDFKGRIGGIVSALKTAAVAAGVAAIGFGATFLKSAADLQQTSQSMQVLTGNTQVANKLFGQLATYANSTPFEFPQVAKAAQTMLGFGISSDKVYSQLQMLGDISAATGADLGSLSLVFGQVNATGKLMGQDALQLINNQIPIFNILGKKMGLTAGEVKQKMEEGAISADIFNQALADVTKQGGFAFQGTAKLATTFNGRISTLKDTFLEFGRSLLGVKVTADGLQIDPNGVFQKLSTAVLSATKALQSYAPQAQAAFGWLVDHAGVIVQAIAAIAAGFAAFKIASFVGSAVAAVQAAGGLGAALMALVGGPIGLIALAVAGAVAALAFLQMKFDVVGKAMDVIVPIIKGVWNALQVLITGDFKGGIFGLQEDSPFIGFLLKAHDVLKAVASFVAGTFKGIFESLGSIFKQIGESLKPFIDALVEFYQKHAPAINNILKIVGIALAALAFAPLAIAIGIFIGALKLLQIVLGFVAKHFDIIKKVVIAVVLVAFSPIIAAVLLVIGVFKLIVAIVKVVGDVFSTVFNAIVAVVTTVFGAIAAVWNGVLWPVINFIISIITTLGQIWFKVFAFIALIVVGTISIIAGIIFNVFQAIFNFLVNTILTPIWNFFTMVWNAIWTVVTTVANAIWSTLTMVFTAIWNTVVAIFTGIWNTITGVWNAIYGFLAPIVGAIFNTIANAFRNVWNFISGIAGNIWSGITGVFNSVVGFVGGIGGRIVGAIGNFGGLLYDKGRDLINGLINGAGSLLSSIGKFFLDKVPGWIRDPFKKALGIASPSKVFAGYGKNIVQGLTNGIGNSVGMISSAMSDVSNAVSTGLSVSASPTVTANVNGQNGQIDVGSTAAPSMVPNIQSSADNGSGSDTPIIVQPVFNGPIIGNDSGLRELSVTMAKMVQDALKGQGTDDINMLRSTS